MIQNQYNGRKPRRQARGGARSTAVKGRPGVVDGAPAAEAGRPGAPGELKRHGKPLALAGRPGRRRKTEPISSSGGAIAEAARRRRSNGGHCRPGSLRREAGGGVGHAVKGGRVKLAVRRQRRPAGPEPRSNSDVMASFSCCRLRQGEGDHAGVRVAQAQPARRPSHLKRPRTEPRLVAGRCTKVKVLIAVPQRRGKEKRRFYRLFLIHRCSW
jgi:hypothetical protein